MVKNISQKNTKIFFQLGTIGERIRNVRANETQSAFAARLGITQRAVVNYETGGRVPKKSILGKIKEQYGINPEWLLTGDGEKFAAHPATTKKMQELSDTSDILEGKNAQHTEITNKDKTILSNTSDNTSLQQELLNVLRDNASLLRQLGDLRVEVERQKARIAELERQITEGAREAGDEALARLELENRQLREENRVLKRGRIVLAPETDRVQGRPPE